MTKTLEIPIIEWKKALKFNFPQRCAQCGQPKDEEMRLEMNLGRQSRRRALLLALPVPLCKDCAARERQVTKATLLPFLGGGLLVAVIVFIPVWLVTPGGATPRTRGFDLLVGLFAALVAGLLGGTLVEYAARLLLAPFIGDFLLRRPLSIVEIFGDIERVLDFQAKLDQKQKKLLLTFPQDDFAQEFAERNKL